MYLHNFSFTAVFVEDPQGGYSAYVEELPGANAQGETIEEAKENLKEAIQLVLEANKLLTQRSNTEGGKSIREKVQFSE